MTRTGAVRLGIGGPVGSGKTALVDALCKRMRDDYRLGVVTNDIFTREDMEFLVRSEALAADRIIGVQTGGCPHTAIREDASINFDALDELARRHPDLDLIFVESGGDNLAASFSPELVDAAIYVIDVSGGVGTIVGFAHDWANPENTRRSWDMVARYVIPEIQGLIQPLRSSRQFVIDNREVFERAGQAVMAKIMENERAAAALQHSGPGRVVTPTINAPDLQKEAAKRKA